MTERKRHPDNELIAELAEYPTPAQGSRAGGNVSRDVGTRSELGRATDPQHRESVEGSDNPAEDARKGEKTSRAIRDNRKGE